MGCYLAQSKKANSIIQGDDSNLYYEEMRQQKDQELSTAHIFNFCQKNYILLGLVNNRIQILQIYDIDANKNIQCEINCQQYIKDVFANQNFLYIKSYYYLYKLCLVGDKFIVKNRYHNQSQISETKIMFINRFQGIILEENEKRIRLKSLQLQKQIFRIEHTQYNSCKLLSQNGLLIYIDNFVCIRDIRDRRIIIRQLILEIQQIVIVQNTDDILIQIDDLGLFLYKINYTDRMIQQQKILNLNVEALCSFDDNNLLNLITPKLFIKFNKFYDVIQRFSIYYECSFLKSIKQVYIKQNVPELICINSHDVYDSEKIYTQKKIQKREKNDAQFYNSNNYKIEYLYDFSQQQHLISPDQRYLAFLVPKSLMFHKIQGGSDVHLQFSQSTKFINFSSDSNSLYVVLDLIIYCYKTRQNMKREFLYHQILDKLQTDQSGIVISINRQGSVIAISKKLRKIIFKFRTIYFYQQYRSFDYDTQRGTILVSSDEEVSMFNLADRSLIIKYQIENRQCKLIQSTQNLLVLTKTKQLQLWSQIDRFQIVKKQMILGKVTLILKGYQELYCFRKLKQIILMNKNFQIIEQIDYNTDVYNHPDYDFDLINQDDQIIQKGFILRMCIALREKTSGPCDLSDHVILSLEPRQSKQ